MDQDESIVVVPVFSTRRVSIAGGSPMEQAVPQDYALASMLLRALDSRNGRNLEFFIKAYMPFRVHASSLENRYFLSEALGLGTGEIELRKRVDIDGLIAKLRSSETHGELRQCINELHSMLDILSETERISVTGFCPAFIADPISVFFHWPSRNTTDSFSLVLPDVVDLDVLKKNEEMITEASFIQSDYLHKLQKMQNLLHGRIGRLLASGEASTSSQKSKLEERITYLRREIGDLESRLLQLKALESGGTLRIVELEKQRDARIAALKRDENRLKHVLSSHHDSSNELQEEETAIRQRVEVLHKSISKGFDSLTGYLVAGGGLVQSISSAVLMVPFLFAGFSRKGKLSVDVYPPSYLLETPQSVGRLRDFVDAFTPISDGILIVANLLKERANSDVSLRKTLRESSATRSLLTHPQGRILLADGIRSLVSDALARESVIEEIDSFLSGLPESETAALPKESYYSQTSRQEEDLCSVTFHIHDASGAPVTRATIELGSLKLRADSKGIIRARLPKNHHEATVLSAGLQPKQLDFTLRTADDIVVPVVMTPLSDEARLEQELDALLERANRIEGIREKLRSAFDRQGDTLLTIPTYRAALEDLLAELGYEPESWIASAMKKKGMVKRLLKKNDRIDGLKRDVLQMAEESRQAGGIMLFSELLVRLANQGWDVNSKEMEAVVSEMSNEGLVEGMYTLDSGALLVKFIPVSLTDDPQQVLSFAAERSGKLAIEDLVVELGWTEERVTNALELLVEKGVAKVQKSYSKSTQYWFPGLRGKK